jgi:hypothetical protein
LYGFDRKESWSERIDPNVAESGGLAVANYSGTLGALPLKPSGFCNIGEDAIWISAPGKDSERIAAGVFIHGRGLLCPASPPVGCRAFLLGWQQHNRRPETDEEPTHSKNIDTGDDD